MDDDAERRARAEARRQRAVLRMSQLVRDEHDLSPIRGADAIALVEHLTRESWSLAGRELPSYARHEIPCRFVPRRAS